MQPSPHSLKSQARSHAAPLDAAAAMRDPRRWRLWQQDSDERKQGAVERKQRGGELSRAKICFKTGFHEMCWVDYKTFPGGMLLGVSTSQIEESVGERRGTKLLLKRGSVHLKE